VEKKREVMIVFKIAKPHEGGELTNTNMAGCGIMRGEVKVKVVREVKLRARRLLQVRTVPQSSGMYACFLYNEGRNLSVKGELKDLMSFFITLSYSS